MTRLLYVGYEPDAVDYSNPALPPGMNAERIRAGNALALKQFADRGWEAEMFYVRPDGNAGSTVEHQLRSKSYDCVVIGAGIRVLGRLADFEAIINAVHKGAPSAAIAFNTRPEDSAEAAARWLQSATAKDDALVEPSLEETALDRARDYVAELEAQAKVPGGPAEKAAQAAVANAAQPTREEADARALEEFQRLRERSTKKTL